MFKNRPIWSHLISSRQNVFCPKGEAPNYPGTDWPACVFGCVTFPQIDSYKATNSVSLLPNMTTEYACSMSNLIPYTGYNLTLTCQLGK